jgi:hypothetical protein
VFCVLQVQAAELLQEQIPLPETPPEPFPVLRQVNIACGQTVSAADYSDSVPQNRLPTVMITHSIIGFTGWDVNVANGE